VAADVFYPKIVLPGRAIMVNVAFGEYQVAMSELLLFVIAGAFGALCFGFGFLIAFIVMRKHRNDE
jgi:hypothetical protein